MRFKLMMSGAPPVLNSAGLKVLLLAGISLAVDYWLHRLLDLRLDRSDLHVLFSD